MGFFCISGVGIWSWELGYLEGDSHLLRRLSLLVFLSSRIPFCLGKINVQNQDRLPPDASVVFLGCVDLEGAFGVDWGLAPPPRAGISGARTYALSAC